jgi:class 3 adenylate cyclase
MTELARGTVTFVFTDIEGSTRLLASLAVELDAKSDPRLPWA